MTGIGFLGCGYVANMYRMTLPLHPRLRLVAVHDRERARAETMARLTGARVLPDLDALCSDAEVEVVVNLTNPIEHYATTRALLEAGKHVYSEKPLAMRLDQAEMLADLAEARRLMLVVAPCTLLNPVAQETWAAVREARVGPVRLVYAEMEDGMVHRAPVAKWINEAGIAWPAVDEFATGCTVEHAGYVLSWLCAIFGPVESITAQSEQLVADKMAGIALPDAADLSVAMLAFAAGVVARMTNGIYAPHDHRLRLFGDDGVIEVEDPRSDTSKIWLRRYRQIRRRRFLMPRGTRIHPAHRDKTIPHYRGSQVRDFCRAIADMESALRNGRRPATDAKFALHLTEVTLACHASTRPGAGVKAGFGEALNTMPYRTRTRFLPPEPLA